MTNDLIMDFRSLAKLISKIENNRTGFEDDLMSLYKENSETLTIGITGPPGAGSAAKVLISEQNTKEISIFLCFFKQKYLKLCIIFQWNGKTERRTLANRRFYLCITTVLACKILTELQSQT